jgi:hypothetical protein
MTERTGAPDVRRRPREAQSDGPIAAARLNMLVATGARERIASECRDLLAVVRFELTRIVPTTSGLRVFEAPVV